MGSMIKDTKADGAGRLLFIFCIKGGLKRMV
jgi:hypothetical protein